MMEYDIYDLVKELPLDSNIAQNTMSALNGLEENLGEVTALVTAIVFVNYIVV